MKIKVLMIGPGKNLVGGILSLCEIITPTLQQKVDLLYFPTVRKRPLKDSGKLSLTNIALAISQLSRFIYSLYDFDPDIIHIHTSQGIGWLKDSFFILIGKAFRKRIVLHVHAASFDVFYRKRNAIMKHYTRRIFDLADAIIAVSTRWKDCLSNINPNARIYTFRNCISVDQIMPCTKNSEITTALFLGSVGPRKGVFDLIEAMGILESEKRPIQLLIAGEEEVNGDLLKALNRKKELRIGDNCEFLGAVRSNKKLELLNKANVFVLPSYDEGLPMAVLEAMAAGLAIVTTPVGGIPEVVKEGYNGYLVNPGDIHTLTRRLSILDRDVALREEMGRRSRDMCKSELDVNPYAERLVALYQTLSEKRSIRRGL